MNLIKAILSFPKIVYLNFRVFPVGIAIKLPICVHYHTKIGSVYRGCIIIDNENVSTGMIKLGCSMGSAGVFEGEYPRYDGGGFLDIKPNCKIVFRGNAFLAGGFSIRVDNGGIIEFGKNFGCNSYCFFAANKLLHFGDNCTLGWNVKIRDVDGHNICRKDDPKERPINPPKSVIIGNRVWIAANVNILKGTSIPNDCVVAYGSMLTGQKFSEDNTIIGGNPPRVLKENMTWYF